MRHTAVTTEGIANVAALGGPESNGGPPSIRVRVSALNILGDLVTVKPPNGNLRVIPEHSENTTTASVERGASASLEVAHGATGVVGR
jgi:hypothetical protein